MNRHPGNRAGMGHRGRRLVGAVALAALASLPTLAGESKRCTAPIQECLDYMSEKMRNSGFVGVEIDVDEETGTYTVQGVIPGTPAEEAGIMPGDQLYALNGVRIIIFDFWPHLWKYQRQSFWVAMIIFLIIFIPTTIAILYDIVINL